MPGKLRNRVSWFLSQGSMRSMLSMRGGFIFRNWGPSLEVHRGQCLTSMTKHDAGGHMCGM
jgi:hypothetical protein